MICQCNAALLDKKDQCNTMGCPLSRLPPQDFSGTLTLYPNGMTLPTEFTYRYNDKKPV